MLSLSKHLARIVEELFNEPGEMLRQAQHDSLNKGQNAGKFARNTGYLTLRATFPAHPPHAYFR